MADSVAQKNTPKLVVAHANNLRISPRKVRLVTNLVKNNYADKALTQLAFTNKKAAPMVIKALKSAIANATNNFSMKADDLFIKSITVDMGPTMKRFFPRARGSAEIIRRKTSHVHVVLEERPRKSGTSKQPILKRVQEAVKRKPEEKEVKPVEVTTDMPETTEAIPPLEVKSSEERKASDIAQKRRPQVK